MTRLSKRGKVLLGAGLLVFSVFLFYHYLLQPLQTEIASLSLQNDALQKELQRSRDWRGKEDQLYLTRDELVAADRANAVKVPHEHGKAEILVFLEAIARAHNLALQVVEQQEAVPLKLHPFSGYSVKCKLGGNYCDMRLFLQALEEGGRLISIERVRIQSGQRIVRQRVPEEAVGEGESRAAEGLELDAGINRPGAYEGYYLLCDVFLTAYFDPSLPGPGGKGLVDIVEVEKRGVSDPFLRQMLSPDGA